jgi:hypothetical protein
VLVTEVVSAIPAALLLASRQAFVRCVEWVMVQLEQEKTPLERLRFHLI